VAKTCKEKHVLFKEQTLYFLEAVSQHCLRQIFHISKLSLKQNMLSFAAFG